MKITDSFEVDKVKILSEKKSQDGDVMNVLVPCVKSDIKNSNGRIYKKPLLQREFAKLQNAIQKKSLIGTGDHPKSGIADIETASHLVTKLSMDEQGQGWAEMRILPTDRGRNIQTLIRNDATLSVSLRGFGEVGKGGTVLDSYLLAGIDIVAQGSDPTARFSKSNIFESLDFEEENRDKELEEEIDKLERESYLNAHNAGFIGSQQEWLKTCGSLKEAMGLPVDKEKALVEKLTEETINAKILSFYNEAVSAGYIGSLNEYKEKFPAIVESASEVKVIIEKKVEPKAPGKMKMSLAEAKEGGFRGTISEWAELHPDIELVIPESLPQKKVLTERELTEKEITEEAGRIFTALSKENNSLTLEDVKKLLLKEEIAKSDKRLRKRAISIVNASIAGSGASPSQELLEKMVTEEIEDLKVKREEMRKRNWACYEKLLD